MNKKEKELFKLGKKHQKWPEDTNINANAYYINDHAYYLAFYESKFSTKVKANAVISPDSKDRHEALQSIKPHIYFSISCNNLKDSGSTRGELDYSPWEKVRDYLKHILEAGVLNGVNKIVYKRSYHIMQTMIDLQHEMIDLWKNATALKNNVDNKGFFTDEEVEKVLHYVAMGNLIQYKQFKDRYDNCKDFDLIYENRDNPEIKPFQRFADNNLLKGMTSEAAEHQLKNSLDQLTRNQYFDHMSESEIYDRFITSYREGLDVRVQKTKEMLRHP
ncbi:hypothetical protein [Virgibacillus ainsalahensis]